MRTISYEEAKDALETVAGERPMYRQPYCENFGYLDHEPCCLAATALAVLLPGEFTFQWARRHGVDSGAMADKTMDRLVLDGIASFDNGAYELFVRAQGQADQKRPWGEVVPQVLAELEGMT